MESLRQSRLVQENSLTAFAELIFQAQKFVREIGRFRETDHGNPLCEREHGRMIGACNDHPTECRLLDHFQRCIKRSPSVRLVIKSDQKLLNGQVISGVFVHCNGEGSYGDTMLPGKFLQNRPNTLNIIIIGAC